MCEFISYIANNEKLRFGDFMELCPVYAYEDDRELFGISENQKEIFVDLVKVTLNSLHLPVNVSQSLELPRVRGEYIHAFLSEYALDSNGESETLFLSSNRCKKDERFTLDADRLLETFPKLKLVICGGTVEIINSEDKLYVLDPFDLGEMSFLLLRDGDNEAADVHFSELSVVDMEWLNFWLDVAMDYKREPEDHPEFDPNGTMVHDGMDDLFRIYLLGWYSPFPIEEEEKIYVEKHKNFQKAIELLPVRFQNCSLHEVSEKLYWDLQYVEADSNPDFDRFFRVLAETELLYPGALDQMFEDWFMNDDEKEKLRDGMTRATNAMKGID